MNPRLAHLLVCLYPPPWRERYAAEFEALLQTGRGDLRTEGSRDPHHCGGHQGTGRSCERGFGRGCGGARGREGRTGEELGGQRGRQRPSLCDPANRKGHATQMSYLEKDPPTPSEELKAMGKEVQNALTALREACAGLFRPGQVSELSPPSRLAGLFPRRSPPPRAPAS